MIKRFSGNWLVVLLVLMVAALGVVVAGNLTAQAVQAAQIAPLPQAGANHTCAVVDVGAFTTRVHVHCAVGYVLNPTTTIYWFAYPTSDSAGASRLLSVFETAKATGSTVTVFFETTDLSGANFGCQTQDCRTIIGAKTP